MGLQVGHHIFGQMALYYRVNSLVSPAVLDISLSTSYPTKPRRKVRTISEAICNIANRKPVHRQDWREKVIQDSGSPPRSSTTKAGENCDGQSQSQGSLSSKQFSGWELAWHLAISESQISAIEAEVHAARTAIGKYPGKPSRSGKSKLVSTLAVICDPNVTRAGASLLVELEKLVRQIMVLAKSNADLKVNLERPALEKNGIVHQIVGKYVTRRSIMTDPILAIGYAIRIRYLENCNYHSRNKEKILTGNRAAHDGDSLADAMLYYPAVPNHRTDLATYSKIYGLLH